MKNCNSLDSIYPYVQGVRKKAERYELLENMCYLMPQFNTK